MLVKSNPEEAKKLLGLAEEDVASRWRLYDYLAHEPVNGGDKK
jgi:pyruvate-ferredoxin/flavodoxin oxidoreductase